MLDFDNFREIWSTLKKNKLRTVLTGFSVAWGIFMLIIMLGAGNGLRNGILYNFRNIGTNRVEVWAGYTTKPWKGMPSERAISFKDTDLTDLKRDFKEIALSSASITHADTLYHNNESIVGQTEGVFPNHSQINNVFVSSQKGRFINEQDMKNRRKIIVLSPRMAEVLFHDENPIGKFIKCNHTMFQVVGVYDEENKTNNAPAYIPFSVSHLLYNKGYGLDFIVFTLQGLKTQKENDDFLQRFRAWMAQRHQFDPTDYNAIHCWSSLSEFIMTNNLLNGITLFIWIIGIGTLMAGIVGVSNIMLITVRERTKEFGIRKALGAKPRSILTLIIMESILVTAFFGYIGMVLGIGITELINHTMEMTQTTKTSDPGMSFFLNPTVNLNIAVSATALIVIAGVLAGYFPARKAIRISAIEAMRTE